ncbi:hypothetical protein BDR06DRAFT_1011237 [Suillus hirtellus]|nr:hypothetical protein BDR06DRAFT_1011237 [Suillus hirtellus]
MFQTLTLPLNAICPLNVKKFTDFILVPYIATSAIAHRFTITIIEAHTIWLDSRSAGIDLHPALDSDEELDQIYRTNVQRSKSNTRVAIHDNKSSKGGPPRLHQATLQLIEATLPQPGPSQHPNTMRSSSDCPSQEYSTIALHPPDSALSQLTPLPPSPAQKQTCSKTKAAVMPIEEEPIPVHISSNAG